MTDTATERAAAIQIGLPPGVVLPVPDGTIDSADRAHLAGAYGMAFAAVDAEGVMLTVFLAEAEPVPAGAFFLGGFAHNADGHRYVAAWPASDEVYYRSGVAARSDGAMVIIGAGSAVRHNGWSLTQRGEVIVSTDAPEVVLSGFGMRQDGSLCVSEAA